MVKYCGIRVFEIKMATHFPLKTGAITLTAIKNGNHTFPVLVRTLPSDYEVPNEEDLPDDDDVLLDKLGNFNLARVRVLPFTDEDASRKNKGERLVTTRKKLEGQEVWISAEYRGTLKILKSSQRPRRFISISQVLENCPRFVKVGGDMDSCLKGLSPGSGKLVPENSILELRGVIPNENTPYTYLECSTGDCVFYFRDDQIANMVEVDDPTSYSLLGLKQKSIPLPLQIMFDPMPWNDISLKDDEKKYDAYALFHGPLVLLQFVCTSHIIAWTKVENDDPSNRHLAIIPKSIHDTLKVSVYEPISEKDKNEYLDANFTDYEQNIWIREHSFVIPTKRDKQFYMTWLKRPNLYLSIPEYDLPIDDLTGHSTASPPDAQPSTYGAVAQGVGQAPEVYPKLPFPVKKNDTNWKHKLEEKARLGFNKLHKEMLIVWKKSKEKASEIRDSGGKQINRLLQKSKSQGSNETETENEYSGQANLKPPSSPPIIPPKPSQRLKHSQSMKDRPLPPPPSEHMAPLHKTENQNFKIYETRKTQYGVMESARGWQLNKDFYSFTAFDVHECMKFCFPDNPQVADTCLKEKLDGEFFKTCDLEKFGKDVGLTGINSIKFTQIVKQGWRPKF
ncbi:uncharacterized protein LOC127876747 [Dreissena polymorpha]|nr:uncharacterized protein LOC127876747 [Dreissena polymorpha]